MNTGQMMLVIGAFTLLSVLVVSINSMILGSTQSGLEMDATLNAISVAQSMLDEITQKAFDEKCIINRVYQYSDMTAPSLLGCESGESLSGIDQTFQSKTVFDDVDDYNNYQRQVQKDTRSFIFDVVDTVEYVSETSPDTKVSTQTFAKRITVTVRNPYLTKQRNSLTEIIPLVLKEIVVYRRYF